MSKQRGVMQAQRHVRQLIRQAGCEDTVRIVSVTAGARHFIFWLENPKTKMVGRLTMSQGARARSGSEFTLRQSNIHLIRQVAGAQKVA